MKLEKSREVNNKCCANVVLNVCVSENEMTNANVVLNVCDSENEMKNKKTKELKKKKKKKNTMKETPTKNK